MANVCFPTTAFLIFIILLVFGIISSFVYYKQMEDKRFDSFCKHKIQDLKSTPREPIKIEDPVRFIKEEPLEKMPERRYIGPHDYSTTSQQVGYIHNDGQRFPLYENRRGRNYYYHSKDGSRNGIRVVIDDNRTEPLNDGETISVPELGGEHTVKMYEYSGNQYNPYVF